MMRHSPVTVSHILAVWSPPVTSHFPRDTQRDMSKQAEKEKDVPLTPCQDEGKEGKRETKIDRPWQNVSSLGKRGVKMGRWTLSTETFRSRRGFVHLMQSTAPQQIGREPGQIGTRAHRQ